MKTLGTIFLVLMTIMIVMINSCERQDVVLVEEFLQEDGLNGCSENLAELDSLHDITRSWLDYSANDYCVSYTTTKKQYVNSKKHRKAYKDSISEDYTTYWGKLYESFYKHDQKKLSLILDSLSAIKDSLKLDRDEFANVVVSFVQDIPYSYILYNEKCEDQSDPNSPCVEGEIYGILTPFEFIHTLKGDCDTRTVLLYAIFKHFNYAPKVVISLAYEHSMLLLDVAATGEHIYEYGKTYYFWETTGTGWEPGIIPAGMGDLYFWDVALE